MSWCYQVFTLEIRKVFSYRVAFWLKSIIGPLTGIAVAYFLWKAVFEQNNVTQMKGYSFHGLLYYYIFANLSSRVVMQQDQGPISKEIYEGGLTRYLVYPVSFFTYMYFSNLGKQMIAAVQLVFGFFISLIFLDLPADQNITLTSILQGVLTSILAGGLMFLINALVELVAFWQDVIWNLLAMLRFVGNLLGGLLIPLSFFPDWAQTAIQWTPFPVVYTFPIRCFLGQVSLLEWSQSLLTLGAWTVVFILLCQLVWGQGVKQYTGVGL